MYAGLAAKVSDFSRTGLKIKIGEWDVSGNGPLRQDRPVM
jgi:GH35 family endo-1,4-beta-xylanase